MACVPPTIDPATFAYFDPNGLLVGGGYHLGSNAVITNIFRCAATFPPQCFHPDDRLTTVQTFGTSAPQPNPDPLGRYVLVTVTDGVITTVATRSYYTDISLPDNAASVVAAEGAFSDFCCGITEIVYTSVVATYEFYVPPDCSSQGSNGVWVRDGAGGWICCPVQIRDDAGNWADPSSLGTDDAAAWQDSGCTPGDTR